MKTAITLSLLPSRPTMPFVLGPDLTSGFETASALGFDAVEIFPPSIESIDVAGLNTLSQRFSLPISTIGTGGGAVAQGLTLTDSDKSVRDKAKQYVRDIIAIAGDFGGSAIIGSMQGRAVDRNREEVLKHLGDALAELGEEAARWSQPLLFEPLNRYESDLVNRLDQAVELLQTHEAKNARVLADLFHMNIEETCINSALRDHARYIGHVHFVDSNRWPAGAGHSDLESAYRVLQSTNFSGYLAVEAFPLPNQQTAAENAAKAFRALSQN